MPRTARYAPEGLVYHALNRAVARLPLFEKQGDYQAFEFCFRDFVAEDMIPPNSRLEPVFVNRGPGRKAP